MALSTSIVLCTFNGARFLEAQWDSLLCQSRLPDEIVVRDDASTDHTPDLLDGFVANAQACGIAVRYIRGERNLGFVANFDAALRAASGDVLFLCDQDDVWYPAKLATQLALFEKRSSLLLLCGNANRMDDEGAVLARTLFEVLNVSRSELRRIHANCGFGVLLRRSLATGATIALRRELLTNALPFPDGWVHDEWLAIIAAALNGFDCIEIPLVGYRQHDRNQIGMRERGARERWNDLRNPRRDLMPMLIGRDEQLQRRLQDLGRKISPGHLDAISEKLLHLRTRQRVAGRSLDRIGVVVREWRSGRYARFGSGWHSALRDLIRRR